MNTDTAAPSTGTAEPDARRALVEQTIILIETEGEPAVRVDAVARRAGVPVTSIYQWFDGRAELIEAAQRLRHDRLWARTVRSDLAELQEIVTSSSSPGQFTTDALALAARILSDDDAPLRLTKMQLVGDAVGTDGAQQAMAALHRDGLQMASDVFADAMDRTYVRTDLDPAQAVVWVYLNLLSRVFTEFGDTRRLCAGTDAVRHDALRWLVGRTLDAPTAAVDRAASAPPQTEPDPGSRSINDELHPTASRILEQVLEHLEQEGELRLRLRRVARSQQVSESLIHRHFGNREQLLVHAHTERFRRAAAPHLSDLDRVTAHCTDVHEFTTYLRLAIRAEVSAAGAPARVRRLSVLGAAEHRPQLLDEIARTMLHEASVVGDALTIAADRGWISASVDPQAVALWLRSLIAAQACFELGPTGFDQADWARTITAFLEVLLAPAAEPTT